MMSDPVYRKVHLLVSFFQVTAYIERIYLDQPCLLG